jgi:glycosyltransferase involved in cell wall biosynthesis
MKISIITPSFNQGQYITDAIESVISQDYKNFEHIVIDACSTDTTIEQLKRYPHLKWISEPDKGQSDAINKGFKMASGEIICWLNADDFYLPGTFSKVINLLSEKRVYGIYSDILFCDKEKNIIGKFRSHRPVKWLSLFHTFVCSESFFFKRKILDSGISIDENLKITMDKEFIANILFSKFKLKYSKDTYAVFRKHDQNKSLNSTATKVTNSNEGIAILNRYLKLSLPKNAISRGFYRYFSLLILPIRPLLRFF